VLKGTRMSKQDTRGLLIAEGARLIHEKGFNHTGVQEVLQAAGVPKGSFYFYFRTKEEFGLAVIDHFLGFLGARMDRHLGDESLPHLQRLRNFFNDMMEFFGRGGCSRGCPVGNLAQELADLSDTFRAKLRDALGTMESRILACIEAAVEAGEIVPPLDARETASFILNSWEGALTRMKTEKSLEPLVVFDRMIFQVVLRMPEP
jgi:TetR/AcrR family transcriptional regulator, transcriptional repressor for nem operon